MKIYITTNMRALMEGRGAVNELLSVLKKNKGKKFLDIKTKPMKNSIDNLITIIFE